MYYSKKANKGKYGNINKTVDGIKFDSIKEADRYRELKFLERCGSIEQLELQKKFVLIPAQYENPLAEKKKDRGKCLEQACTYKADFYYYDKLTNKYCCEDTKGFKTKDYIIKRKLMLYVHGIRIIEV